MGRWPFSWLGNLLDVINRYGYEGFLTQEITDGRYFNDPATADIKNFQVAEPYFID